MKKEVATKQSATSKSKFYSIVIPVVVSIITTIIASYLLDLFK
ncbi:hypothetical protein [Enterococcus sp. BWR-S5]|nr:hypothetical protein [Enterococcus sp. BWR-S5]